MKHFLLSIFSIAAVLPATFAKGTGDSLCTPLRAFVSSIKPNEKRELIFHTSWGGNFKGESEQAVYATRCEHRGYEPAKAVCAYLDKNASVEFPGVNAKRVIACLSHRTIFAPDLDVHFVDLSFSYGTPNRGSLVDVKLYEDTQLGGIALSISLDGY